MGAQNCQYFAKFWGILDFRETTINSLSDYNITINMYVLIEIRYNILIQCYGFSIGVTNFNYMFE